MKNEKPKLQNDESGLKNDDSTFSILHSTFRIPHFTPPYVWAAFVAASVLGLYILTLGPTTQ